MHPILGNVYVNKMDLLQIMSDFPIMCLRRQVYTHVYNKNLFVPENNMEHGWEDRLM